MEQVLEDLVAEFAEMSHNDNAVAKLAVKYGKTTPVMWQFLVAARDFLDNGTGMEKCPDCDGEGYVEIDVPRPHNVNRDVGYLDTVRETCEMCQGDGEIYNEHTR